MPEPKVSTSTNVPVTQTGPDQADSFNVDENASFSDIASSLTQGGDSTVPEGMHDVRNEPMTIEEVRELEQDKEAEQSNIQAASTDAVKTVPEGKPTFNPLSIGKHNLTSKQVERLNEILGGGFDLLDALWGTKDEMWQKMHGAVQEHYHKSNALRDEGRRMMEQGQALLNMAKEMMSKISGGTKNAPGGEDQIAEVDMEDPIVKTIYPMFARQQKLIEGLQEKLSARNPMTDFTINQNWDKIRQQMGGTFEDAVASVAGDMNIRRDSMTGEHDLKSLTPEKALDLQQKIIVYNNSIGSNREQMNSWFAEATKDLSYLPKSRSMIRSFWSQIMEDIGNDKPVTPQSFRFHALQAEKERREEIEEMGKSQAATRKEADQPIVPTAGSATPRSGGDGKDEYEAWKDDGTVDFRAIGQKIIRESRLPKRR